MSQIHEKETNYINVEEGNTYFCIIYFVPSHGGISKILPKQTHNKVKISENVSLSFLFIGFTFTFTFNTLKYT